MKKKKVLVPSNEKIKDKKSRKRAIGKAGTDRLFDRVASISDRVTEISYPSGSPLRTHGKGRPTGVQLGKKQKLHPKGGELKCSANGRVNDGNTFGGF